MFVFFKSWRGEDECDGFDLTKCSKCKCYFLDQDCIGICDRCSKEANDGKAIVRRMTTNIVRFINR